MQTRPLVAGPRMSYSTPVSSQWNPFGNSASILKSNLSQGLREKVQYALKNTESVWCWNWQTSWSQKPVGLTARAGSSPAQTILGDCANSQRPANPGFSGVFSCADISADNPFRAIPCARCAGFCAAFPSLRIATGPHQLQPSLTGAIQLQPRAQREPWVTLLDRRVTGAGPTGSSGMRTA